MGIRLIHGFLHEKQTANPEWGNISISEVVLVETDSPTDTIISLINALPAAPNTVTSSNPKGISFTFDSSLHPDVNGLVLRKAGEIKQVDQGGCFWEIPLTYALFEIGELTGPTVINGGGSGSGKGDTNPKKRKDQRAVLNPLDKPVVWTRSSSTVQKGTFQKRDLTGPILHTNGLPITEPYMYEEIHTVHTFSYNINFTAYTDATYAPYVGCVNSSAALGFPTGTLKFTSLSSSEEYQSNSEDVNRNDYHYVRVVMSFEYNPTGWDTDAKLVSMSTLQLTQLLASPFTVYYDKIKTSATAYAESPWPLDANGLAIPYDNNLPANYGYVDHGYPALIDLNDITNGVLAGLKNLVIP